VTTLSQIFVKLNPEHLAKKGSCAVDFPSETKHRFQSLFRGFEFSHSVSSPLCCFLKILMSSRRYVPSVLNKSS